MNGFQNKTVKRQYVKCKLVVKRWEDEFTKNNGRLPTKADIKLSPANVRQSYNRYYRIKTELLASQILSDDTFSIDDDSLQYDEDTTTAAAAATITTESNNSVENNGEKDEGNVKSKTDEVSTESSQGVTPQLDKIDSQTWGPSLNVKKTEQKPEVSSSMNVLSQKLFKCSTFNKRNPRRSSSSNRTKSLSKQSSVNSQETLGDASQSSNLNSPVPDDAACDYPSSTGNLVMSSSLLSSSPSFTSSLSSSLSALPVLTKLEKCSFFEEKSSSTVQKLSLIQEVTSCSSNGPKRVHSFHEGWVERCVETLEKPRDSNRNSDSGFDSIADSPIVSESPEPVDDDSKSDDDFICASDNECDESTQSSFIIPSQKRKSQVLDVRNAVPAVREPASCSQVPEGPTPVPTLTLPPTPPAHVTKKLKLDTSQLLNDLKANCTGNSVSVGSGGGVGSKSDETKAAILERKIKSGSLNDNFVKINLEKKTYVRGKKKFNFSQYKKQQWKKDKKMLNSERESGGVVQCFKCGEVGHFARRCKKNAEDKLLECEDGDDLDEDTLPTLEEAQKLAEEKARDQNFKFENLISLEKPQEETFTWPKVDPIYDLAEDGSVMSTPPDVYEALNKFGHSNFRPGQEETVMRMLSGLSTLLIVSTGGGKSLCYQLPAYLYAKRSKCITLVISPLVSLMEDQVSGSSSFFKAGCLHTSQTEKQRQTILEDARNGKLHALLVSPEAVVSGDSSKAFGAIFKQLPPIAFACIDEVHCISQWSHNFRPSYLMVNKVLREKFGIRTILGLTATATVSTIQSITSELGISTGADVIKDIPVPENLRLSVSRDANKDEALIALLKSPTFADFNAILVYCTRRDDCERLAVLIRTVLQDDQDSRSRAQAKGASKRLSWTAESYHAGMAAARRKQVQKAFMSGNLRIVVATVAFGMGINKQDIRAVVHYNMPRDFESYVQELGRAGRDGLPARCHLFLEPRGTDLDELRRHIHANSLDRHVLRKLLQRVFVGCKCPDGGKPCGGHENAFNCAETINLLDIPEENIHTLLCYLELHSGKFLKVLAPAYTKCKVKCYKGLSQVVSAAKKCPPLAYACALAAKSKRRQRSSVFEFNVVDVARDIDWKSSLVKRQLKNLEWEMTGGPQSSWKKTGVSVEFSDLGFRVLCRGDLSPEEQDDALDYLIRRVETQEKRSSNLLDLTFNTLQHFSCPTYADALSDADDETSNRLKTVIRGYFETEQIPEEIPMKKTQVDTFDEDYVASDVRALLSTYRDNTFNARAVARIFHGIQSPNYPASLWYSCRFWRKHMDKDFNRVIGIAQREILRWKL